MRLKATLLAIVAVLSFGFTSCTDELASDQTKGKPGYLTINVKTLQPKQTKLGGAALTDYQIIKDLNVFIVNGTGNVLVHKYYATADISVTEGATSVNFPVNELNTVSDKVLVVANYGSTITATSLTAIEGLTITTVRDAAALGLHMTGIANITSTGYAYTSPVRIAPVESKITVDWTLTPELATAFNVTGVYVVNAISSTQMPVIRENTWTTAWAATNKIPANYINLATRVAATGYTTSLPLSIDFNIYETMTQNATLLSDEDATSLTGPFHYYVGENYSNNTEPTSGTEAVRSIANTGITHANTIVIVKVKPTVAGEAQYGAGERYYTYEFSKASTAGVGIDANGLNLGTGTILADGFSVRRKTNYNLNFNLTTIGATEPFKRIRTLTVNVTADAWDDQGVNPTF